MSVEQSNQLNKKSVVLTIKSPYFNFNRPNKKIKLSEVSSSTFPTPIAKPLGLRMTLPFFNVDCELLAKALLGCVLVRVTDNKSALRGVIVETECYLGGKDKASLSYGGKITERNRPMYMTPGTTFVYMTYGMYNLINVSSKGEGAAVLIRALEPLDGIEEMTSNRQRFQPNRNKAKIAKEIPTHKLCNGPAKLCISFGITKGECNMQDLTTWDRMWIEQSKTIPDAQIVKSRRIGIDSAGPEWANKLLRYYIIDNNCVSKRDKAQEVLLKTKD